MQVVQAQHPTQCQKQGDLPAKEERRRRHVFFGRCLVVLSGALDRGCKKIGMYLCEFVMGGCGCFEEVAGAKSSGQHKFSVNSPP